MAKKKLQEANEGPIAAPEDGAKEQKPLKKVKRPKPAAPPLNKLRGAVLRESIAVARKEYGDLNICAASEADRIVIGLPLPSLAFEYLIQNTVWPLGRFTQIVGKPGCCKSALTFEMARWFGLNAGVAYLFENETKYSPDWPLSIIGYPASEDDEILVHTPCTSVDDWQSKLQFQIALNKKQMMRKEIGRKFPVLYIVDSLMGKLAMESQGTIEKEGSAGRSFPVEALMINSFLKKIPQDLEEWPMCLVATNHLKPAKDAAGRPERHKAGGHAPNFQETFELEMSRDANANICLVDPNGFEINGLKLVISCKKNSLGETDRQIRAEVRWTYEEDETTGEFRQVTKWDWAGSTVKLLSSFDKGHRNDKIKEIVDIQGSGNKWYSKTYGIKSDEAVSATELGELIEADEPVKAELRKLFGIKPRKVFQADIDYVKQLNALRQIAERNMVV